MTEKAGVTAVVCCYASERWPLLVEAIRSLRAQSLRAAEILVVVDHNDELLTRASARLEGARVVPNRYERGLSGGRNTALETASQPLVAFLDDDAVAPPDWLATLVAHLAVDGVVGAGSGVAPAFETARPAWFPPTFDWVVGCSYEGLPEVPSPVRNTFGGASLVRTALALEVGGFRTDLGRVGARVAGCEETEFFVRLRRGGGQVIYDPRVAIDHRVPATRTTRRYFLDRCYQEGRSKALVAMHVGARDGLASERAYVRRTLPRAMLRDARAAVRLEHGAAGRVAATAAGLAAAAAGYAVGTIGRILARGQADGR